MLNSSVHILSILHYYIITNRDFDFAPQRPIQFSAVQMELINLNFKFSPLFIAEAVDGLLFRLVLVQRSLISI